MKEVDIICCCLQLNQLPVLSISKVGCTDGYLAAFARAMLNDSQILRHDFKYIPELPDSIPPRREMAFVGPRT
jgi:hypothetical protein